MFARLTMLRAQMGKTDDVLKMFRGSIIPAAKRQKGFKQVFLFTKENSDQVVWLTFWNSQADLQSAEDRGFFKEQIAQVNAMIIGAPITDKYEIATKDRSSRWQLWRGGSAQPKTSSS